MRLRQLQYPEYQTAKQGDAYARPMPKPDEWRQWGKRMRAQMKRQRKSREQVAEHMKVSYSLVGHWGNGTRYPYVDELFKLSDFLGADPRDLLFGEMTIDAARRVIDQALESGRQNQPAESGRRRVVQTPTGATDDVPQFPGGTRDRAKKRKTRRA